MIPAIRRILHRRSGHLAPSQPLPIPVGQSAPRTCRRCGNRTMRDLYAMVDGCPSPIIAGAWCEHCEANR